MSHGGVNEV